METQGKLNVEFPDLELLQRFDVPGPRYTSYPTADRFTKEFGAEDFKKVLNARGTGDNTARIKGVAGSEQYFAFRNSSLGDDMRGKNFCFCVIQIGRQAEVPEIAAGTAGAICR